MVSLGRQLRSRTKLFWRPELSGEKQRLHASGWSNVTRRYAFLVAVVLAIGLIASLPLVLGERHGRARLVVDGAIQSVQQSVRGEQEGNREGISGTGRGELKSSVVGAPLLDETQTVTLGAGDASKSSSDVEAAGGTSSSSSEGSPLSASKFERVSADISHELKELVEILFSSIPSRAYSLFQPQKLKTAWSARATKMLNTSVYVTIKKNEVSYDARFTPPNRHQRYLSLRTLLSSLTANFKVPDCEFVVVLNDGNKPMIPAFGPARHWKGWRMMIPFPLGNERGRRDGSGCSFQGWNAYTQHWYTSQHGKYPWDQKIDKAVFRGNFQMQTHQLGSCNDDGKCKPAILWRDVNRGRLYEIARMRPDLFDVGFTSVNPPTPELPIVDRIPLPEQMQYKYFVNVGTNQDWAERMRNLLFMNSAIFRHEAETAEWFYPLLKAGVHYIPVNLLMSDFISQMEWAKENDDKVREIVAQANRFAHDFLSEEAMLEFAYFALCRYAQLQGDAVAAAGKG